MVILHIDLGYRRLVSSLPPLSFQDELDIKESVYYGLIFFRLFQEEIKHALYATDSKNQSNHEM